MEDAHSLLERIVCDKDAGPANMPISLLNSITENFSNDRKIGSGGFAVVYKGLLENGAVVAVKKLSELMCMDENKYNQEVGLLLRMKHKNIVRFLGYCADTQGKMVDHGGKFVMADVRERLLCFEYVPKGTLNDYITDASTGLDWEKRYQIIKGICEGLHYIHKQDVVHLDLKPANILLDDNMVPKIADFGISKCFDQEKSWVTATKVVGTLGYLAPEFAALKIKITFKFDMYSLGVIMLEILTGQKDYSSVDNVTESWRNRVKQSSLVEETALKQIRVCSEMSIQCMSFNPEGRPTIQHILELLEQTEFVVQQPGSETRFNDDEKPPAATSAGSPKGLVTINPAKYAKRSVALTADTVTAMVEMNATSSSTVREGLDLVAVLDMSGSMRGEKMESLKAAMMFVIMKLTPHDRLSIVTFSGVATRLIPLRSVTPAAQSDLKALLDSLSARGSTDIKGGLELGLAVIAGRVHTNGRTPNIFLLTDGQQTSGDARLVETGQVDVYTFGWGRDTDHLLMSDIARKSPGGTFSSVAEGSTVSLAFSQLLAGLLTVVAQDVQLTITPKTEEGDVDTIAVAPGTDYKQVTNAATGVVTIKFGTLFAGERRRVIVALTLKDVSATMKGMVYPALLGVAQHSFTSQGRLQHRQVPQYIQIKRTWTPSQVPGASRKSRKVQAEIARREHADAIRQVRLLADEMRLAEARRKLGGAQIALEDAMLEDVGRVSVNELRSELLQLMKLIASRKMYEAVGHGYALASETSHGRQRYAARGFDEHYVRLFATPRMDAYEHDVRLFATPRMDAYLEQAKNFEDDPTALLPYVDDDLLEEYGNW